MGIALVFPGQGSQREGMATAWRGRPGYERWAEAGDILGWDVERLGTRADADDLREPYNCQIALFVHACVQLASWRALVDDDIVVTAGHSLGEYAALVAADVLDFSSALQLVAARARATKHAADQRPGTMVACIGYEVAAVEAAAETAGAHVANDNAPGQVVCAGSGAALETLRDVLAEEGGRGKVVALEVGAAYHSPHMEPAVEPFGETLDEVTFARGHVPVVANVDATAHRGGSTWAELLRRQLVAPVRWRESVAALADAGTTTVVELCASPVLVNLVKRTDRSLERRSVVEPEVLETWRWD